MTRHILILALLLQACTSRLDSWQAGDGFDGWRADSFRAAAAQWCQAAELCAELGDGANLVEIDDSMSDGYLAYYEPDADGATISVQPSLGRELLTTTLLHELGHHWGCEDVDDPNRVMHFSEDRRAGALSLADIECAE